jgi:protein-arginine kinase activator protein McsA
MQKHTAPELTCPACAFPESRLRHSLQLGCPVCYKTFAPHLATFLPKLHTGTLHKGKSPAPATLEALLQRINALADRIATEAPHSPARLITDTLRQKIQAEIHPPQIPLPPSHPSHQSPSRPHPPHATE